MYRGFCLYADILACLDFVINPVQWWLDNFCVLTNKTSSGCSNRRFLSLNKKLFYKQMRVSKRFRKRNKDYFAGIGAEEKMVKFPGE